MEKSRKNITAAAKVGEGLTADCHSEHLTNWRALAFPPPLELDSPLGECIREGFLRGVEPIPKQRVVFRHSGSSVI